eukprot:6748601-Pyramimonas_sp.AAC.1
MAATDLDDGMGIRCIDGIVHVVDRPSMGPDGRSQEHQAGTLYRERMKENALASVTSWYPCGSAYYGHRSC